ncbi:hypothetical protein [Paenibacillus sp. YAF4_2]|uniref:hypothetical protein n=1 Tax=Paenibacillus sp. YAF4_2 TaxID=3233085 RepID=UPI003F9C286E
MKEKVLQAFDKLAIDYERNVDTSSGHNAFYERPAYRMVEVQPSKEFIDLPEASNWYSRWYERLMTEPWFLIVRARR